ncbi:RICIN domain-containing protein [Kribbella sp. NPDC026611]|uniref:RICIN domain-containing protein n=1 Tax=Kribbella sp. NPDC026611 TaxID=3154911 RepID=UPI0033E3CF72
MPRPATTARLALAAVLLLPAALPAALPAVARPSASVPRSQSAGPASASAADPLQAEAARTGKPVELMADRTETAQVFVNPDGHHTLVQHVEPVRVRRGSGWVAVDPTLAFQADGTVRPAATSQPLTLSGGGSRSPLVTLGTAGRQIRLSWPTALPRPVLDGATATYREVFPGVDLLVRAETSGFSHLLVVKNATAARNPALRSIAFGLVGDGLKVSSTTGSSMVGSDSRGRPVFTSGTALMWDRRTTPDGTPSHQAKVGTTLDHGRLVLRPDERLLTAPDVAYPVSIDPSWTGSAGDLWTHVNRAAVTTSYWNFDRAEGAKVGAAYQDPPHMYRSLFQLNTAPIAGARVIRARFTIELDHTPTSTPTPVQLWQTRSISRSEDVTWNSTANHWLQWLDTESGHAWTRGGEPNQSMGFAGDKLLAVVQSAADQRLGSIGFGLRADSETDQNQWKKFVGGTASIAVDYNNPARMPLKVNFTEPQPCGTASAPTMIRTAEPSFAAVGSDPDGDAILNRLEIHRAADDGLQYQLDAGPTSSGAAFSWSAVPPGTLSDDVTYYYSAASNDGVADDGVEFGPASPRCYFRIDRTPPGTPVLSSTAFPNGSAGIQIRTVGVITLTPAAGATDVVGYRYGFSSDKMTLQIKAAANGSAQLPVTVNPDPLPTRTLYVQALDQAGNASSIARWSLIAKTDHAPPVSTTRGDVNGDGLADVAAVVDQGAGETGIWNVAATPTGFGTGTRSWASGVNGGFPLSRTLPIQGDFTGDGRSDQAFVHDEAGRQVAIYLAKSEGNRYDLQVQPVWRSDGAAWSISTAHVASGDLDGDHRDDIVVQLDSGNGNWRTLVYPGSNLAAPVQWLQTAAGSGAWSRSRPVIADVDGDGKDDLVVLKDLGGCRTAADLYRSTGTAFSAAVTVFDSGAGAFCADRAHAAVGDVDGDGKDDIVALYDNGTTGTDTSLRVLRSAGTALTASEWWHETGKFDAIRTTLSVGDHNGDKLADAALVTALDGGGREVFDLRSTGTSFAAPASVWRETAVGASTAPRVDIEPRTYELVSRNTGRCVEVAGASQTDPAVIQQWDCFGGLHQRFRIVPTSGTDQYQIQMVHERVAPADGKPRCMDVGNQSTADNTPIVQWQCAGTANQQVLLDYVEGTSYDTVVRLRFAHSDKCAEITNPAAGNGAALLQMPCDNTRTTQQWVLRAALNTPQLSGQYAVRSMLPGGFVLDVKDCTVSAGLRLWDLVSGSKCQHWDFRPLGDDIYQIVDLNSNTALQVLGCSRANAATVITLGIDASECQRWRVEPAVDGSVTIQQADTGKTLDAAGCVDARGVSPIVWPYWNGPCQRWHLER